MMKKLLTYGFSTTKLRHINPYTREIFIEKEFISESEIFSKVVESSKSQQIWKSYQLSKRKEIVTKIVQEILKQKQQKYELISKSIGKSIKDIDREYKRLESVYQKLINSADIALGDVVFENTDRRIIKYIKQPLGIALLFPFFSEPIFDTLVKSIPALVAGNTILIKSSPYCPFVGQYFQSKFNNQPQLPQLISDIFINSNQTQRLFQFKQIKQITFSGSVSSGRHIFQLVAQSRMIDVNFFYGAKDAAYIDQTVDIDQIIYEIVTAAFYNCGQSFDSLKRLYIHQDKSEEVLQKLVQIVQKLKIGNPLDPSTDIGPICIQQDTENIEGMINEAVTIGAECLIGGTITTDSLTKGYFVEPTILNRCESNMQIVQSQISAPILCCTIVQNQQQFIQQLNSNKFGIGTRIFTKNVGKYQNWIEKMQVGRISFNKNDYIHQNLPIEGWKQSGKGRILSSEAYEQFIQYKSIYVQKS